MDKSTGAVNQNGLVGDGLYFDGTNDYVSFGVDAGNSGTSSFTASFWAKWAGSGQPDQKYILNSKEEDANSGWYISSHGSAHFKLEGSGAQQRVLSLGSDWSANDWHHVVIQFYPDSTTTEGGRAKNYVNGAFVGAAGAGIQPVGVGTGPLLLGSGPNSGLPY